MTTVTTEPTRHLFIFGHYHYKARVWRHYFGCHKTEGASGADHGTLFSSTFSSTVKYVTCPACLAAVDMLLEAGKIKMTKDNSLLR